MFRLLTYLVCMVFLLSVVRSIVRFVMRGFAQAVQTHNAAQAPNRVEADRASIPLSGELKKDPVCGTYTAAATALQRTVQGQTFYFCSPQCRDKFGSA